VIASNSVATARMYLNACDCRFIIAPRNNRGV
jgi:hypothetical protein